MVQHYSGNSTIKHPDGRGAAVAMPGNRTA